MSKSFLWAMSRLAALKLPVQALNTLHRPQTVLIHCLILPKGSVFVRTLMGELHVKSVTKTTPRALERARPASGIPGPLAGHTIAMCKSLLGAWDILDAPHVPLPPQPCRERIAASHHGHGPQQGGIVP